MTKRPDFDFLIYTKTHSDCRKSCELHNPGVWNDEPDRIDFIEPTTGYRCLLNRNASGSWCGYVFFPADEEYTTGMDTMKKAIDANTHFRRFADSLTVHGGATYSKMLIRVDQALIDADVENSFDGHIMPLEFDPNEVLSAVGFDCSHAWDYMPYVQAALTESGAEPSKTFEKCIYRDMNYAYE